MNQLQTIQQKTIIELCPNHFEPPAGGWPRQHTMLTFRSASCQ